MVKEIEKLMERYLYENKKHNIEPIVCIDHVNKQYLFRPEEYNEYLETYKRCFKNFMLPKFWNTHIGNYKITITNE